MRFDGADWERTVLGKTDERVAADAPAAPRPNLPRPVRSSRAQIQFKDDHFMAAVP
jgi:hypothetical protein